MIFDTEAEARRKWCPFARDFEWFDEGPVTVNRTEAGAAGGGCKCLASDCMAWRWSGREHDIKWIEAAAPGESEPERPASVPAAWEWVPPSEVDQDAGFWIEDFDEWIARREGCCGAFSAGGPL
jgi:hypothetical protein